MKAASERGRIGAWAYEARAEADLSVEEVAERLTRSGNGVTPATIRGIEGGSKQPSRRLLRALAAVYNRPVPGDASAGTGQGDTQSVPAAYLETVNALVEQMAEDRKLMLELLDLVRPTADRAERNSAHIRALEAELQSLRARSGSGA